jgi:hypothetical protein
MVGGSMEVAECTLLHFLIPYIGFGAVYINCICEACEALYIGVLKQLRCHALLLAVSLPVSL